MNKKEMTSNTGYGIATILMIFVVLIMVILSLMTYLSALKNVKMVQREAEYIKDYYIALEDGEYRLSLGEDDMIIEEKLINNMMLKMERKDGVITYRIAEE